LFGSTHGWIRVESGGEEGEGDAERSLSSPTSLCSSEDTLNTLRRPWEAPTASPPSRPALPPFPLPSPFFRSSPSLSRLQRARCDAGHAQDVCRTASSMRRSEQSHRTFLRPSTPSFSPPSTSSPPLAGQHQHSNVGNSSQHEENARIVARRSFVLPQELCRSPFDFFRRVLSFFSSILRLSPPPVADSSASCLCSATSIALDVFSEVTSALEREVSKGKRRSFPNFALPSLLLPS
jgi:hypothetical protein